VLFNNKLWVVGGYTSEKSTYFNDVWYAEEGSYWYCANSFAPFTKRSNHSLVVFNNRMWLIGGQNHGGAMNDIYVSSDGVSWSPVYPGYNEGRHSHAALTFKARCG